jgi:hypothetical protein
MKQFSRVSRVALLLLALALPAVAAGPIITVVPFTPFVIPADGGCGTFDVYVALEPGRPYGGRLIQFANSEMMFGPAFVTLTNLSTLKAINLNIGGPVNFSFTNNTLVLFGPTLDSGLPANLVPPGLPLVAFAKGRTVVQFDNSGNVVSVSFTGTAQDLCQLLQ